jgi:hypothetical protein
LTRQRFSLDRLGTLSYIGAGLTVLGCRGPAELVPAALAPVARDSAVVWAQRTVPRHAAAIRFKWRYEDGKVNGGGRATVRLAPPDSLRLDFAATLGLASGAGVIVGDSVMWADPDKDFRTLVRGAALLWASFGTVRPPAPDAGVSTLRDGDRVFWRFATADDTLAYLATTSPSMLEMEWRRAGVVLARSRVTFDGRGWPTGGRSDFPDAGARFEFTVLAVDTTVVVPPALWRARR